MRKNDLIRRALRFFNEASHISRLVVSIRVQDHHRRGFELGAHMSNADSYGALEAKITSEAQNLH